jgi:hypothetical protein
MAKSSEAERMPVRAVLYLLRDSERPRSRYPWLGKRGKWRLPRIFESLRDYWIPSASCLQSDARDPRPSRYASERLYPNRGVRSVLWVRTRPCHCHVLALVTQRDYPCSPQPRAIKHARSCDTRSWSHWVWRLWERPSCPSLGIAPAHLTRTCCCFTSCQPKLARVMGFSRLRQPRSLTSTPWLLTCTQPGSRSRVLSAMGQWRRPSFGRLVSTART